MKSGNKGYYLSTLQETEGLNSRNEEKKKREWKGANNCSQHLDHNKMDPQCLVKTQWKITNELVVIRERFLFLTQTGLRDKQRKGNSQTISIQIP